MWEHPGPGDVVLWGFLPSSHAAAVIWDPSGCRIWWLTWGFAPCAVGSAHVYTLCCQLFPRRFFDISLPSCGKAFSFLFAFSGAAGRPCWAGSFGKFGGACWDATFLPSFLPSLPSAFCRDRKIFPGTTELVSSKLPATWICFKASPSPFSLGMLFPGLWPCLGMLFPRGAFWGRCRHREREGSPCFEALQGDFSPFWAIKLLHFRWLCHGAAMPAGWEPGMLPRPSVCCPGHPLYLLGKKRNIFQSSLQWSEAQFAVHK